MGKRNDLILRLVEEDLTREQLAGASIATLRGLRAGRRGGPTRIPKKRIQLAMVQNWRCHWCQQQCREEVGWQNSATLDHVVPQCQGGGNEPWNLVMSCWRCNLAKDRQHWEDFQVRASRFLADARSVSQASAESQRLARARRAARQRPQATWFDRLLMECGQWAHAIPA